MYTIIINNIQKLNFNTFTEVLQFLKTHDHCNNNTMIFKNDYLFAEYCYPSLWYNLNSLTFVEDEFPKYSDQINNLKAGILDMSGGNIQEFVDKDYKYCCVDNFPDTFDSANLLKILSLIFFVDLKDQPYPLMFHYSFSR